MEAHCLGFHFDSFSALLWDKVLSLRTHPGAVSGSQSKTGWTRVCSLVRAALCIWWSQGKPENSWCIRESRRSRLWASVCRTNPTSAHHRTGFQFHFRIFSATREGKLSWIPFWMQLAGVWLTDETWSRGLGLCTIEGCWSSLGCHCRLWPTRSCRCLGRRSKVRSPRERNFSTKKDY